MQHIVYNISLWRALLRPFIVVLIATGSMAAYSQPVQTVYVAPELLPPGLTSFIAKQVNNKIWLVWSNNKEENLSHYIVERSFDNNHFSEVGLVFTGEKSDCETNYTLPNDIKDCTATVIYYRLKLVDTNGASRYSPVKTVRPEKNIGLLSSYTISRFIITGLHNM